MSIMLELKIDRQESLNSVSKDMLSRLGLNREVNTHEEAAE